MTMTWEEAIDRYTKAKRFAVCARWKLVEPATEKQLNPILRAVCGAAGCPASLGILTIHSIADIVEMRIDYANSTREIVEQVKKILETKSGEKRAGWLQLLGRIQDHAEASAYAAELAIAAEDKAKENGVDTEQIMVGLHLEPRRARRGTPKVNKQEPIYTGYPETGFSISSRGKRDAQGYRIGRRTSWTSHKESVRALEMMEGGADPFRVHGQFVQPPCDIYCPVCGTLNKVEASDDFYASIGLVRTPPVRTL